MAPKQRYLIDKSALSRRSNPTVDRRLCQLTEQGRVATCAIVELEVLYSARSYAEYLAVRGARGDLDWVDITPAVMDRTLDVQERLARTGHHRVPIPDLILAAAAESAGLVVLHYDADFERIAAVTRQKQRWSYRAARSTDAERRRATGCRDRTAASAPSWR